MTTVIKTSGIAACVGAALGILTASPAPATEITSETVALRIEHAGDQRMLAERMAKFYCFARSGVDPMTNVDKLNDARARYQRVHDGLAYGDEELKLFEEQDRRATDLWRDVDLMWTTLDMMYDRAMSGDVVSEGDFDKTMQMTLEVTKRNNDMVAQIRTAYSSEMGDGGFGQALLLDLYDRQLMLSQKLGKEVCLVARNFRTEETIAELGETLKLFETSLNGFREGMPIAGIPKPPTAEIAERLDAANAIWADIRDVAAAVSAGRAVTMAELTRFASGVDAFMPVMREAVDLLAYYDRNSG